MKKLAGKLQYTLQSFWVYSLLLGFGMVVEMRSQAKIKIQTYPTTHFGVI
ncbi:hypothetical protein [Chlorogloeopsis sp. ULAP02]